MRTWGLPVMVTMLVLAAHASAQGRPVEETELPRSVAEEAVEFFNDPGIVRFNGPATVPAGRVIVADVAMLGGPFVVSGRIDGDLLVVNGDLQLLAGGLVEGDVMVIGGRLLPVDAPGITGDLAVFDEPLRYVRRGDLISVSEVPSDSRGGLRSDLGWGRSRLTIRAGTSYNRVEGLPVVFGPIVETRGSTPLVFEALGTWRTESSLNDEDLGYRVRLEQRWKRSSSVAIGVGVHSLIEPIESWGLTDTETSLATFLLHKDFRDHFERTGWSVWSVASLAASRLILTAEYRDEDHRAVPVGSPWTFRKNDHPWRPQPVVGQGSLRTLSARIELDWRNDRDNPTDGWFARARLTRGLSGEIVAPALTTPFPSAPAYERRELPHDFTHGFLDLRRYNRVSPDADLRLRLLWSGRLGDAPLPPQYQSALGGEGSLPGYPLMSLDCGARTVTYQATLRPGEAATDVFPAYGCDRTLLFQAEYRGYFFDLDLGPDDEDWEEWDWYPPVDFSPSWSAFFNLGRGWADDGATAAPAPTRADTGTYADVGAGLFLGDLGLFWAFPLQGEDRSLNFFIRLTKRF